MIASKKAKMRGNIYLGYGFELTILVVIEQVALNSPTHTTTTAPILFG